MACKVKSLLFRYLQAEYNTGLFAAGLRGQLAPDLQRVHGNQFWPLVLDYCGPDLSLVGTGFALYNNHVFSSVF